MGHVSQELNQLLQKVGGSQVLQRAARARLCSCVILGAGCPVGRFLRILFGT